MELIQHTVAWCKGEIFEGKMSLLFGAIIVVVALAYWKFASTQGAQTMWAPLLAVGLLASGAGIYLVRANTARIPSYEQACAQAPAQFAQAELARTEAFIAWYPRTRWIMAVIVLLGMACMIFSHAPWSRSVGIALILLGLYVFVLDHFSEERARTYHARMVEHFPA